MNILCSLGNIFKIEEIKEFPRKTMLTIVTNRVRIIVTRYSCGDYYAKLPNGKVFRVSIRKWFPEWDLKHIVYKFAKCNSASLYGSIVNNTKSMHELSAIL